MRKGGYTVLIAKLVFTWFTKTVDKSNYLLKL